MGILRTIALALLLAITGGHGVVAQSATPDVAIEANELAVDGTVMSISPDGAWLFGAGEDREACLWSVPDLEAMCDGFVPGLDPMSVAWSPDSTVVAFSQDAVRQFIDSDVYTMSTGDGAVISITDDPVENDEQLDLQGEAVSMVDTMPLWADDGSSIAFIRTVWSGDLKRTSLARVDPAAETIEEIFVLSPIQPFAAYAPLFATADGGILVSIDALEPGDDANGIWTVAADGSRIDRVTAAPSGDEDGRYVMHAIADDASMAVVQDIGALIAAQQAGQPVPWSLLDLATGEVTPMLDAPDFTSRTTVYGHPVFIPGTSEIVYLLSVDDGPLGFATGTGDAQVLVEIDESGDRLPTDMTIATTGEVLVTWNDRTATLFSGAEDTGDPTCTGDVGDCREGTPPPPCSCAPEPTRESRG